MTCPGCGRRFSESAARLACSNCALFGGCKKVKCPYCGYEMPAEPPLMAWIKKKLRRKRHE